MVSNSGLLTNPTDFLSFCNVAIERAFNYLIFDYYFRCLGQRHSDWNNSEMVLDYTKSDVQVTIEVLFASEPVVYIYELGKGADVKRPVLSSGEIVTSVTLDDLIRRRCPEETGWPFRQPIARGWPRSSNKF